MIHIPNLCLYFLPCAQMPFTPNTNLLNVLPSVILCFDNKNTHSFLLKGRHTENTHGQCIQRPWLSLILSKQSFFPSRICIFSTNARQRRLPDHCLHCAGVYIWRFIKVGGSWHKNSIQHCDVYHWLWLRHRWHVCCFHCFSSYCYVFLHNCGLYMAP